MTDTVTETLMAREAAEAGPVVRRQIARNADAARAIGAALRDRGPSLVLTLARGSSDNAATYGRYLIETCAGTATASTSPSISSVYGASPALAGTVTIAISQSGRSPDLLAAATAAKAAGSWLVVLVNDETSPLHALGDAVLPLCAGPERSVAATKSFIASLSALLHLLAEWTESAEVAATLAALPDALDAASGLDWSPALPVLLPARSLFAVGRGHGLGIAQEVALKLKETCGIHAEAVSAAEVRHGPMALVDETFPVILLAQRDASRTSVAALADEFAARGAPLLTAGLAGGAPGLALPTPAADPLIEPILQVASFYQLANRLALARGHDPDRPPHLSKVTETR